MSCGLPPIARGNQCEADPKSLKTRHATREPRQVVATIKDRVAAVIGSDLALENDLGAHSPEYRYLAIAPFSTAIGFRVIFENRNVSDSNGREYLVFKRALIYGVNTKALFNNEGYR